jgi:hypothetical protein
MTLSRRVALFGGVALSARPGLAAPGDRTVYFMRGSGAASLLADERYQNILRGLYKGDRLTFDFTCTREQFLSRFFKADIAYLSLHASETKLKVGSGEIVESEHLQAAFVAAGRAPRLTIVVGCRTTKDSDLSVNVPQAVGIGSGRHQNAYIGFNRPIIGHNADRFFRFFMPHWVNPAPDGSYRSLTDARDATVDFLTRRFASQREAKSAGSTVDQGDLTRTQQQDINAGRAFDILGNGDLRANQV